METQKPQIIMIEGGNGGEVEKLAESMKALSASFKLLGGTIGFCDIQSTSALHPALAAELYQPPKLKIPEIDVIKNYNPKFEKNKSNKDYKRKSRKLFQ